jgi:hypothetical protein
MYIKKRGCLKRLTVSFFFLSIDSYNQKIGAKKIKKGAALLEQPLFMINIFEAYLVLFLNISRLLKK